MRNTDIETMWILEQATTFLNFQIQLQPQSLLTYSNKQLQVKPTVSVATVTTIRRTCQCRMLDIDVLPAKNVVSTTKTEIVFWSTFACIILVKVHEMVNSQREIQPMTKLHLSTWTCLNLRTIHSCTVIKSWTNRISIYNFYLIMKSPLLTCQHVDIYPFSFATNAHPYLNHILHLVATTAILFIATQRSSSFLQ